MTEYFPVEFQCLKNQTNDLQRGEQLLNKFYVWYSVGFWMASFSVKIKLQSVCSLAGF